MILMLEWLLIFILLFIILILSLKYSKLKGEIEQRAREIFERWRNEELNVLKDEYEKRVDILRKEYESKAEEKAKILFQQWKENEERRIRKDAIKRSTSTILGRVGEHLTPLIIFLNYGIKPKDFRFLGTPVDFIAFKGLSDGKPEEIIFIEVKSGSSTTLSNNERKIKKLIEAGKVKWMLIHLPKELEKLSK
ncbi:MAG TPA: Holliday junction resolvase [Methanothermococcus okinawensis]|nr:Holliday junction resolvase [Methanothermococcus okinawensis]